MSSTIYLKQHDTEPLDVTLGRGGRGKPLDVSDDVQFFMRLRGAAEPLIQGECTVLDGPHGKVRYAFLPGELDTIGTYDAEWQVTFTDGSDGTWPKRGYKTIIVTPDLGPFVS